MDNRRCPATGKVSYETKGAAQTALYNIKTSQNHKVFNGTEFKRQKRRQGKPAQKRAYLCEHCDQYHLTSWETSSKIS